MLKYACSVCNYKHSRVSKKKNDKAPPLSQKMTTFATEVELYQVIDK